MGWNDRPTSSLLEKVVRSVLETGKTVTIAVKLSQCIMKTILRRDQRNLRIILEQLTFDTIMPSWEAVKARLDGMAELLLNE